MKMAELKVGDLITVTFNGVMPDGRLVAKYDSYIVVARDVTLFGTYLVRVVSIVGRVVYAEKELRAT
jgi:hypothetical protein